MLASTGACNPLHSAPQNPQASRQQCATELCFLLVRNSGRVLNTPAWRLVGREEMGFGLIQLHPGLCDTLEDEAVLATCVQQHRE